MSPFFRKEKTEESLQSGNRKMYALKFLNTTELLNADMSTYDNLTECAKTAILDSDVRSSIRYFDLVKQLTTDTYPDQMNAYSQNGDSSKGIYGLSQLVDVLIATTNQFPRGQNVEFGCMITGSNNLMLDQFTLPSIVGIDSENRDILDNKVSRTFDTLDILALKHSGDDVVLGVLLSALEKLKKTDLEEAAEPGYQNTSHNDLFIDARNLVLPIGKTFADYLTAGHKELLGIGADQKTSNDDLKDIFQRSSYSATTCIRSHQHNRWDQYTLLQKDHIAERSFDIDAFGTNISWHPSNDYYRRALQDNQYARDQVPNGVFYDIHLHNAYTDEEIDLANKKGNALSEMLNIVGRDIHMYQTPNDILNSINIAHQLEDYVGLDTLKMGGAILSLTEEE